MRQVVVVGGGFSGVLTAIHLLRADPRLRVLLIEQSAHFGPGRAYSTSNPAHLLNVRAENMSAFPDQPGHFQAWLAGREGSREHQGFVSRGCYGDYLQAQLVDAMASAGPGRLPLEAEEIIALQMAAHGGTALGHAGGQFAFDAAVLAIGLLPPRPLPMASGRLLSAPGAYIADPWSPALARIPPGDVLLVGSGLTMVDVALALAHRGHRLLAVSRRGLLPRSHALTGVATAPLGDLSTPLKALRTVRNHARLVGWREAVDSLRPMTQAVWQSWAEGERRRFLRHLRPWWEVHRHRMAPSVAAEVASLMRSRRLAVVAGSILDLDLDDGGAVVVRYRHRGGRKISERRFVAVVNCTGPHGDLSAAGGSLLSDLCQNGLVQSDALNLGLKVDSRCRAIGSDGLPTPGLFVVGPLTRGAFWETTAVPDLRRQAADVARSIALDFAPPHRRRSSAMPGP